jgi:tetratricopeptide (TPR) repeat protein
VYYNAAARDWLLADKPEVMTDADRDPRSPRTRGFVQAVQNPKLFRQLDRQYRFDTLVLIGDPSQYRPILDHLLDSKDWSLSYLDHTGIIFQRDVPTPWTPDALASVRKKLIDAGANDLPLFLSQAATKLIAVRQLGAANKLIEEAKTADSSRPEVWSTLAHYRLALGQWEDAVSAADQALSLESGYPPALAAKAQGLYATKHFADAFLVSQVLIEKNPDDPGLLFYHAKISHEARAFTEEIAVMERLIELAEREQRPTTGYRMYLAQAYASDGQGEPAIEQFRLALLDPDLPKEQREFAEETSARIKSRLGLR